MTTITIDIPDTFVLPIGRNSLHGSLTVEWDRFPMASLQYILMNGVKQAVNDARAEPVDKKTGIAYTSEEIHAKAAAKLAALYDGSNRVRSESVAADAYAAEALREAKRYTIAVFSKAGLMKNIPPKTDNRLMFALDRHLKSLGKPLQSEAEYFETFFTTPKGKAIKAQAIKTVDERRADSANADDMLDELGLA